MANPVGTARAYVTGIGPRRDPKNSTVKPLDLLCVRDDCYLCMGNEDILKLNPALRIYHGKVTDSIEQIEKFLRGQEAMALGAAVPMEDANRVDITRMSMPELVTFALDEFGITLDPKLDYGAALVMVIRARNDAEALDKRAPDSPMRENKGLGIAA